MARHPSPHGGRGRGWGLPERRTSMFAEGLAMDMPVLTARHLPPGMGQAYRVLGDEIIVKAVAAETGGAYALFEVCTPPGGRTPAHLQLYEDETCFVLEGTYTFLLGERTIEIG